MVKKYLWILLVVLFVAIIITLVFQSKKELQFKEPPAQEIPEVKQFIPTPDPDWSGK